MNANVKQNEKERKSKVQRVQTQGEEAEPETETTSTHGQRVVAKVAGMEVCTRWKCRLPVFRLFVK